MVAWKEKERSEEKELFEPLANISEPNQISTRYEQKDFVNEWDKKNKGYTIEQLLPLIYLHAMLLPFRPRPNK